MPRARAAHNEAMRFSEYAPPDLARGVPERRVGDTHGEVPVVCRSTENLPPCLGNDPLNGAFCALRSAGERRLMGATYTRRRRSSRRWSRRRAEMRAANPAVLAVAGSVAHEAENGHGPCLHTFRLRASSTGHVATVHSRCRSERPRLVTRDTRSHGRSWSSTASATSSRRRTRGSRRNIQEPPRQSALRGPISVFPVRNRSP